MSHDHQLHLGIQGERLFQRDGVHVPAVRLGVDKDGDTALVDHGVQRGVKGHVRAEHTPPLESAVADGRLAVEPLPRQLYAQMQRSGAAGEANRITDLCFFGGNALDLVDILTHGAHPVGIVGETDIVQLLAVHSGGGEKGFLREGFEGYLVRRKHKGTSFFHTYAAQTHGCLFYLAQAGRGACSPSGYGMVTVSPCTSLTSSGSRKVGTTRWSAARILSAFSVSSATRRTSSFSSSSAGVTSG